MSAMSPPTEDPAPAKKRCQCRRGRRGAQASPVPWCGWAAITHSGQDRQRGAQGDCQSSKAFLIRGGHVPKHRLCRPISIAAATWPRVADGFDKTAETASHFVDAFSRSPAQPVNMKANIGRRSSLGQSMPNLSPCRVFRGTHGQPSTMPESRAFQSAFLPDRRIPPLIGVDRKWAACSCNDAIIPPTETAFLALPGVGALEYRRWGLTPILWS